MRVAYEMRGRRRKREELRCSDRLFMGAEGTIMWALFLRTGGYICLLLLIFYLIFFMCVIYIV